MDRWLAEVLPRRHFTRAPASDDASFRRYFRITTSEAHYPSRILMDAPPEHEDCHAFVDVARRLRNAGVSVPEILAQDLERGFLLLSDLGDTVYIQRLDPEHADALYGDALSALVTMQCNADIRGLPAYDAGRLHGEMDLFHQWFLPRHLGVVLSTGQQQRLAEAQQLLVEACLAQPRVFVHRDYHCRNLMVLPRRNPGILDFQDALHGPISYDLVSLLRDVYVEWPGQQVRRWVQHYRDLATRQGLLQGVSDRTLLRWFDLTGVQRHLKVAGIFARLYYRDAKPRYLHDLPLTLRYLHAVGARHAELSGLAALLSELDVHRASAEATRRALEEIAPR